MSSAFRWKVFGLDREVRRRERRAWESLRIERAERGDLAAGESVSVVRRAEGLEGEGSAMERPAIVGVEGAVV